ncbi:hypothetical protein [Vibrio sp. AND4]|nr:hypothetical protein [Vibrio sp. AND4]EDP59504.1 hypothetical protein AND4_10119 [Vibrio sp. AND4]
MRTQKKSAKALPKMAAYFQQRIARSKNKLEVIALKNMKELLNWQ